MGVAPGRRAVVELVDGRVEEVRRHLRRAVGQDAHRLVLVLEEALAGRDLAREVREAGPNAELNWM
jgi:hypothetical protein